MIGLGRMGHAMAQRLGEQEFPVVGWDIDARRHRDAERVGASIARDAADVIAQTDIVLSIVTDDAAVNWLFAPERGANVAGKLFVEMSTLRPDTIRRLALELEARGARLIGAPVLGTISTARAGQLFMLAGGRDEDVERARPALSALTRAILHVGPVGSGNAMKLIVNLSMAAYLQALAEGLALGVQQGLALDLMLSVLGEAPTANGWLKAKLPVLKGESAEATLDILALRKDVMSALATGAADGVAMPMTAGVLSALTAAVAAGFGGADLAQMPRFAREFMIQKPFLPT
jgi:3-hydroxyisobutyrate dehydrogenase-like beta-hydroxyacid dehydrogenase